MMSANPWVFLGLATVAVGSGTLLLEREGTAAEQEGSSLYLAQIDGPVLAQADPEPADADEEEEILPPDGVESPEQWAKILAKQAKDLERREQDLQIAQQELESERKQVETDMASAVKAKEDAEKICRGQSKGGVSRALQPPEAHEERRTRVAAILKKMKPKKGALMVAKWSDIVAIDIMWRLPARISASVLAAMPAEISGRITRKMATGWGADDATKEAIEKSKEEDASKDKPSVVPTEPGGTI
jgi:flagellar motility protein MotE (MotC chaperone)